MSLNIRSKKSKDKEKDRHRMSSGNILATFTTNNRVDSSDNVKGKKSKDLKKQSSSYSFGIPCADEIDQLLATASEKGRQANRQPSAEYHTVKGQLSHTFSRNETDRAEKVIFSSSTPSNNVNNEEAKIRFLNVFKKKRNSSSDMLNNMKALNLNHPNELESAGNPSPQTLNRDASLSTTKSDHANDQPSFNSHANRSLQPTLSYDNFTPYASNPRRSKDSSPTAITRNSHLSDLNSDLDNGRSRSDSHNIHGQKNDRNAISDIDNDNNNNNNSNSNSNSIHNNNINSNSSNKNIINSSNKNIGNKEAIVNISYNYDPSSLLKTDSGGSGNSNWSNNASDNANHDNVNSTHFGNSNMSLGPSNREKLNQNEISAQSGVAIDRQISLERRKPESTGPILRSKSQVQMRKRANTNTSRPRKSSDSKNNGSKTNIYATLRKGSKKSDKKAMDGVKRKHTFELSKGHFLPVLRKCEVCKEGGIRGMVFRCVSCHTVVHAKPCFQKINDAIHLCSGDSAEETESFHHRVSDWFKAKKLASESSESTDYWANMGGEHPLQQDPLSNDSLVAGRNPSAKSEQKLNLDQLENSGKLKRATNSAYNLPFLNLKFSDNSKSGGSIDGQVKKTKSNDSGKYNGKNGKKKNGNLNDNDDYDQHVCTTNSSNSNNYNNNDFDYMDNNNSENNKDGTDPPTLVRGRSSFNDVLPSQLEQKNDTATSAANKNDLPIPSRPLPSLPRKINDFLERTIKDNKFLKKENTGTSSGSSQTGHIVNSAARLTTNNSDVSNNSTFSNNSNIENRDNNFNDHHYQNNGGYHDDSSSHNLMFRNRRNLETPPMVDGCMSPQFIEDPAQFKSYGSFIEKKRRKRPFMHNKDVDMRYRNKMASPMSEKKSKKKLLESGGHNAELDFSLRRSKSDNTQPRDCMDTGDFQSPRKISKCNSNASNISDPAYQRVSSLDNLILIPQAKNTTSFVDPSRDVEDLYSVIVRDHHHQRGLRSRITCEPLESVEDLLALHRSKNKWRNNADKHSKNNGSFDNSFFNTANNDINKVKDSHGHHRRHRSEGLSGPTNNLNENSNEDGNKIDKNSNGTFLGNKNIFLQRSNRSLQEECDHPSQGRPLGKSLSRSTSAQYPIIDHFSNDESKGERDIESDDDYDDGDLIYCSLKMKPFNGVARRNSLTSISDSETLYATEFLIDHIHQPRPKRKSPASIPFLIRK